MLFSLEKRWFWGDMTAALKSKEGRFRLVLRKKFFFTLRVVQHWNSLSRGYDQNFLMFTSLIYMDFRFAKICKNSNYSSVN